MPLEDFDFSDAMKNMLGQGGFGMVFKGRRIRDAKIFAVKMVMMNELEQVQKEVEAQRTVKHPNVVPIVETFPEDNKFYIVMPLYEHDLSWYLKNDKMQDLHKNGLIVKIFLQLVSALNEIHYMGIIHRDGKLQNCLIDKDLNVAICDFGIASMESASVSKTAGVGTEGYSAPEVVNSKKYNF